MTQFADMFVEIEHDPRVDPDLQASEAVMLSSFLTWQRQTLSLKCQALTAEQLCLATAPRSNLTLLGLIRHMADMECFWFRHKLAGQGMPYVFSSQEAPDAAFDDVVATEETVAAAFAVWQQEIAFAQEFLHDAPGLASTGTNLAPGAVTVRWVMMHLIEEYARHNGHADLIRQGIDGRVGQ